MKAAIQEERAGPAMYGDPKRGGLSGRLDYDPAAHGLVRSCPFCGSDLIELCNTHTPSYWLECQSCEGQAHGESPNSYSLDSERAFVESHGAAIRSAIARWNCRVPAEGN